MPKIEADTVAEHRAHREQALLDAARGLLLTEGPAAVTPSKVAAAVGLARSSVYKYFASGPQLLARLVDDDFTAWSEEVDAAVRAAGDDPDARLHAYARSTLQLAAAGSHRVATALAGVTLDDQLRARIGQLHTRLTDPLHTALVDRGEHDPDTVAALVQAAVDAAVRLVDAGQPVDPVVERTLRFLDGALSQG
ncbi:TetR/AcrR family transcriptional regulator [Saccharopolyspora sp. HNM0983]|uniref:TetR/AcrR family transcriptional regulator n=1 Tax=Saccharopolyspora montiporae TaxID=2781240 RepID=A0A929BAA3_9PSEU|nr:TetR/AcrR family transcriptional regulator [Saccharopolyspora sp. HNM0983]MBE9376187.1 TetR/AcrR family transcriptional regulator [Saccharopolyspora sp. HNM0983]